MASATANDIINRAMTKAGILSPDEAIPAGKADQAFDDLNDMLESWELESLMVLAYTLESFSLVIGQSEYTYGTGGDFNSDRPATIWDSVFVRQSNLDYNLQRKTLDEYRRRRLKSTTGRPRIWAFNQEYPLSKVFLYPTPDATYDIYFKTSKEVASFPDRTTSVDLEPGYRKAIINNLALDLCVSYGKDPKQSLVIQAAESKDSIKHGNNVTPRPMTNPALVSISGRYPYGRTIQEGPF